MKIVIWGHKLYSHSQSFLHQGFYKAFKFLGHDVYWFDNNDDVRSFDFGDAVFFTEGQVDQKIPIRKDCRYLIHYCDPLKYEPVKDRCLYIERTLATEKPRLESQPDVQKINEWAYFERNYKGTKSWRQFDQPLGIPACYVLWGTNLTPLEFDYERLLADRGPTVNWVGTCGTGYYGNAKELGPFALVCQCTKKYFHQYAVTTTDDEHVQLIRQSYLAPTIVGEWQRDNGYIPCRLFKNLSYGNFTFTNSKFVQQCMEGRIPYNEDTFALFYEGERYSYNTHPDDLKECMRFVAKNHTLVNRAETLLACLPL